jgi:hypothetical protein
VVYYRWFSFNIFANGDYPYFFPDTIKNLSIGYAWSFLGNLGSVNFTLWRFIFVLGQSLFADFGFSSNISEKFLTFWPTIIFANLFSFALFRKILKSNIGALMGAIVFNYNTYYLIIGGGFLIYAASPWVLLATLVFIKGLETGRKYLYAISGVSLFIAGSYDFRIAYIGVFILFFYSLYYFLFIKNLKVSINIFKQILFSFVSFLIFAFLNIFWVLPMIRLGSLTSNVILGRGLFGNEFLNILYSATLFHPFWTGTKSAWFIVQPILVYFWLIPILAFLGLYLNKKNKNVLFFGIIALLGIFLTKQIAIPFTGIYVWLFAHLPGFNAFREASKFYFLIALGYSVLIGAFIKYFFENFKQIKIYFKCLIIIFIALLFLWNVKPILTGEISGIYIPRHIPTDYSIVNKFILEDGNYYRTLWVPSSSAWSIYTENHPKIDIASAHSEYNYWYNFINTLPEYKYPEGQLMMKVLDLPFSNNLLDMSSVKYVFVPATDLVNDADVFIFYGKPRQYYIDQLDKINWLKKINIGAKDVVVYENLNYRPHIYTTVNKETISKSQTYKTVNFKSINPTQYTISLKNVEGSIYLNFSERYNPQWKLRVGNFNWFNVVTDKSYFISDKYHFQNDANLNSYLISPAEVCKVESCKVNKDGTYDMNMTLFFAPQSFMYLGTIISGSTLVLVLGYLGLVFGRSIYVKRHH